VYEAPEILGVSSVSSCYLGVRMREEKDTSMARLGKIAIKGGRSFLIQSLEVSWRGEGKQEPKEESSTKKQIP
jgi:hypothetical protein